MVPRNFLSKLILFLSLLFSSTLVVANAIQGHQPAHFKNIMIVMFENMSYAEIKNEPTFRRLIEYTGHQLDENGHLHLLHQLGLQQDSNGNAYAFFSQYYNNHLGGNTPIRPSQPNYIALVSGSIHDITDNENYDLDADNLGAELNDAGLSWKVYAENLPDSNCFINKSNEGTDGYQRKHEPLISFKNIQENAINCKKIVNSSHLINDLNSMPNVSLYIPNQLNDGHNGQLGDRIVNVNSFLSTMMGTDPTTGDPLPNAADAPFQRFMANGGLLVLTYDEPSVTGNPDRTIYTLLAGKMLTSNVYPTASGNNQPLCYPALDKQTAYPQDKNGQYAPNQCNHYNLLKMIETNWNLRGLANKDTSSGYKYANSLDHGLTHFWNEKNI